MSSWHTQAGIGVLDNRYVNIVGDTMTGKLVIDLDTTDAIALDITHNVGAGGTDPMINVYAENTAFNGHLLKLKDLRSGGTLPHIEVIRETTSNADATIIGTGYGVNVKGAFIGRSARGTEASPTASQLDDELLFLGGRGYGATGFAALSASMMTFNASEIHTATAKGGDIRFKTTPNLTATSQEKVRILNDSETVVWIESLRSTTSTNNTLVFANTSDPAANTNGLTKIINTRQADGSNNFVLSMSPGTAATPTAVISIVGLTKAMTTGGSVVVDVDHFLNTDGSVVFNETGASVDFRVESDTITSAIHLIGSTGNVGIGTSPSARLHVAGSAFLMADAATATKAYRFRTNGSGLDLDFGGQSMVFSGFPNADFSGTQRYYLIFSHDVQQAQAQGKWLFKQGNAGAGSGNEIWAIRGDNTTGDMIIFNETGANYDMRFEGDTDTEVFFLDASTDRIGISTNTPLVTFDVHGAFRTLPVALTDGATPALNAALGNTFTLAAGGNRTIAAPTNAVNGQKIVILHTASAADRTLALTTGAGGFSFGTDITALTATTSGLTDLIGCIYNSTSNRWWVISYVKGYNT